MSTGVGQTWVGTEALLLSSQATLSEGLNFHEIYSSAKWGQ